VNDPLGKRIQVCSNKIPKGHAWSGPRGLNFYIVIYRELLKNSSQEPIGQFQPNMIGNMLGDGDLYLFRSGIWPLLGSNKGANKENIVKNI